MAEQLPTPIIMDIGCGTTKAGIGGDDLPSILFPTLIGKQKTAINLDKEKYIGQEVWEKRGVLNISTPLDRGKITDWDDLEFIWNHIFLDKLKLDSASHPILHSIYPHQENVSKERMTLIFFESFNVPGFLCTNQPLLSLYGTGKTQGLVVESGEQITSVISINEGITVKNANVVSNIGGYDVNKYLQRLLKERQITLDIEEIRYVKEKACYLSMDYSEELNIYKRGLRDPEMFTLPDGTTVDLYDESIKAPEALFNPKLIEKYEPGLHEIILHCIKMLPNEELKRQLSQKIVLSGGNTLLGDMVYRVNKELIMKFGGKFKVNVESRQDRQFLAWKGGSIVSSLKSFANMWITRSEYFESGPEIIHRKCL